MSRRLHALLVIAATLAAGCAANPAVPPELDLHRATIVQGKAETKLLLAGVDAASSSAPRKSGPSGNYSARP